MPLCCLQTTYNITVTALNWFASYLCEKSFLFGTTASSLVREILQGSVLEPILFRLYTTDVLALTENMQLHPDLYANDIQDLWFLCTCRGLRPPTAHLNLCRPCIWVDAKLQANRPLLKLKSCGVRHLDNMTASQTPHSASTFTHLYRLLYFKVWFVIPYCHKIFTLLE